MGDQLGRKINPSSKIFFISEYYRGMKKFWIIALAVVVVGLGGYFGYRHYHDDSKTKPVATTSASKSSVAKTKLAPQPSYYVGDTQKYGSLDITLNSTGGGTTMGELPTGSKIFSVSITVVNNDPVAYVSPDAFVNESSVYAQVGSNTSTGKYIKAYATPCFGGGDAVVPANGSLSGCVQFVVPSNALVDTYFYNNLKWYL